MIQHTGQKTPLKKESDNDLDVHVSENLSWETHILLIQLKEEENSWDGC